MSLNVSIQYTPYWQMPVTIQFFSQDVYQNLIDIYETEIESNISWPNFLMQKAQGSKTMAEVAVLEYQLALSHQNQITCLNLDIDGLIPLLNERPQEIHFNVSRAAQVFSSKLPICEIWNELKDITYRPLFLSFLNQSDEYLNSQTDPKEKESHYIITTIHDHTEIYRVSNLCYLSLIFLKEKSTSLKELAINHFQDADLEVFEKTIKELIEMGAIDEWKLYS